MSIHAAGCSSNRPDFKIGNRMINNFQIGFEVIIVYLLEEGGQIDFDFFGLMKEIELISIVLRQYTID